MEKRLLLTVCLLVVVSALSGVLYQTGDVPTDETVTSLDVDIEGDAVFVLEVRTVLDTDEKQEAFESFATEVDDDPEAAVSDFRTSVEPLVQRASNETGREMSASNFTIKTRREPLPIERGVVEYRFVWTGFASESGDEIRAGDVLSGYILGEDDALVLRAPDDYVVSSADPTPDSRGKEARWDGSQDFTEDEPRVVFTPEETEGTEGTGATNPQEATAGNEGGVTGDSSVTDTEPETDINEVGLPLYVYVVALVFVLSLVAIVYHSHIKTSEDSETDVSSNTSQPQETDEVASEKESEADDERVLSMIEAEGGRMKQKSVVEETGWSEAKVSKLTSRMEEEGEITKIRLGRENILEMSDEEEGENEKPPI